MWLLSPLQIVFVETLTFNAIIVGSPVAVAQLVESQIVILVVVGSSPISHPKYLLGAIAQ